MNVLSVPQDRHRDVGTGLSSPGKVCQSLLEKVTVLHKRRPLNYRRKGLTLIWGPRNQPEGRKISFLWQQ